MSKTHITPLSGEEYTYDFMGNEGNEMDGQITFSFGVGPDSLELDDASADDLIKELDEQAKFLLKIKKVAKALAKHGEVRVESDFYWSEGDLLIRLNVPMNHPLVKLKTK